VGTPPFTSKLRFYTAQGFFGALHAVDGFVFSGLQINDFVHEVRIKIADPSHGLSII
jgi:hypothetical protein